MIFKGDLVQFLVHTMKMFGPFSSIIALMLALSSATGSPITNCTTSSARSVQSAEVICEDVHDPEDGQQAIIEDEDLVNGAMSKGDQTDSSNDYEIMITPRLWKKLLAAKRRGRGLLAARRKRGRNSRRGKREDGDDDDDIMITPRLWKKLLSSFVQPG